MSPDDCSRWPVQCANLMQRGAGLTRPIIITALALAAFGIVRRAAKYQARQAARRGTSPLCAGLTVYAIALAIGIGVAYY